MLTVFHYLPHFIAGCVVITALLFFGGGDRKRDQRKPARVQHYRWNDQDRRRD